ncbi:MAG: Holliday junction resolvase RuvX [Candidatus Marinimicrobia bacterium]|nr:Holliday junction resolvase RuvX [Candidatus Neomarinimicrobiota bacterium]
MNRILSVDYGNRRIGLALSDPLNIIATPLDTLVISSMEDGIRQLIELYQQYPLKAIVMGYPIGNSGNKTEQTRIVDKIIEALESAVDIPIIKWDERYTSVEAHSILKIQGIKTRNNKGIVDQLAARIMLQEYLDSQNTL